MSADIRDQITNPNETVRFWLGAWPLVKFLAATIPTSILVVLIFIDTSQWYFWPMLGAICLTWVETACIGLPKSPPTLMLTPTEIIGEQGKWQLSWDQVSHFECEVADYLPDTNPLYVYVYRKGHERPYRANGFFSVSAAELEHLLRQRLFHYRMKQDATSRSFTLDKPSIA